MFRSRILISIRQEYFSQKVSKTLMKFQIDAEMSLVFLNNFIIYTTEYEISHNNSPMKYSNGKLILIHFPQGPCELLLL